MDLPRGYNKILQRAYPDCRMRWAADGSERWLLERRANYRRVQPDPAKYPRHALDTFIQHRDGYYLAGFYPPERLPNPHRLVEFLRSQDPTLMDLGGGTDVERAARYAERLEAREAEAKAKARRDQSFVESGAGGELYDMLAWEEGRRVAVPGNFGSGSRAYSAMRVGE
jgi:hypothetical protein